MTIRIGIAAAVFGLMGSAVCAAAQTAPRVPAPRTAPAAAGSIASLVHDAAGTPVAGALVSAVGARTVTGTTDRTGRCTLAPLPPGRYLVRVHHNGFTVTRGLLVSVAAGEVAKYSAVLKPVGAEPPAPAAASGPEIMAAGFVPAGTTGTAASDPADPDGTTDDHSETAWRLRHLPRSVLKDAIEQAVLVERGDNGGSTTLLGTLAGPVHASASWLSDVPFTGQVNLLTTSTFDSPDQLLSNIALARGVAYVSLGAAAGSRGDWNVQAALTQGDMTSWMLAGSFIARVQATHRYRAGMTYAAQRYTGTSPAALAAVADGTRNAGAVFAYDTWRIAPRLTLEYGARYARYGYVDGALFSPRAQATISPTARTRILLSAARKVEAPGAEEFVPGSGPNAFLPPERTFAPLIGASFTPERSAMYQASIERDLSRSTVLSVRTYYERTDDQAATIFGLQGAARDTGDLDHYFIADAGNYAAHGWAVRVTQVVGGHVRGTVDYAVTTAQWQSPDPDALTLALVTPSIVRLGAERLHDLTTSLEADIPQVETRVFAFYRLNSAFAGARADLPEGAGARFDVQVTQPLPFLNFTSAQWEALFGVRSLFGEATLDGSLYDELLVVRPPKRVVGGVKVRF